MELKSLIMIFVCLLLLHCNNKLDLAVGRPWLVQGLLLLCTFPVQIGEYLYHGQKMMHLFSNEVKVCLHKSLSMLSHANGLFYY